MHEPPQEQPSKRSKKKSITDWDMMGDLAKCVVEVLKADSEKIEEPFEHYTYQLRLRLHQDIKTFPDRFTQGYKILLQQLSSKK